MLLFSVRSSECEGFLFAVLLASARFNASSPHCTFSSLGRHFPLQPVCPGNQDERPMPGENLAEGPWVEDLVVTYHAPFPNSPPFSRRRALRVRGRCVVYRVRFGIGLHTYMHSLCRSSWSPAGYIGLWPLIVCSTAKAGWTPQNARFSRVLLAAKLCCQDQEALSTPSS